MVKCAKTHIYCHSSCVECWYCSCCLCVCVWHWIENCYNLESFWKFPSISWVSIALFDLCVCPVVPAAWLLWYYCHSMSSQVLPDFKWRDKGPKSSKEKVYPLCIYYNPLITPCGLIFTPFQAASDFAFPPPLLHAGLGKDRTLWWEWSQWGRKDVYSRQKDPYFLKSEIKIAYFS